MVALFIMLSPYFEWRENWMAAHLTHLHSGHVFLIKLSSKEHLKLHAMQTNSNWGRMGERGVGRGEAKLNKTAHMRISQNKICIHILSFYLFHLAWCVKMLISVLLSSSYV